MIRTQIRRFGEFLIRVADGGRSNKLYTPTEKKPYSKDSVDLFDSAYYQGMNQARLTHLETLGLVLESKSVIDIGSGPGDMAQYFITKDCRVVCVDGRQDNIDRLKERYPGLEGHVADVQFPNVLDKFGKFDIVFCYGLLYHTENPLQVLRNMYNVCDGFLLLETMTCDTTLPVMSLSDESLTATQALDGLACRPSEAFMTLAMLEIGFKYVYTTRTMPDHPQFQYKRLNNMDWFRDNNPMRTIMVASHDPINNPNLVLVSK